MNDESREIVRELLASGNRLEAIKSLRARGFEFVDAVMLVEEEERLFPREEEPTAEALPPLEEYEDLAIPVPSIDSHLRPIDKDLFGLDFQVTTDARGLRAKGASPARVMATLYPETLPNDSLFVPVTWEQMVEEINDCILWSDDHSHPPAEGLKRVTEVRLPALFNALESELPRAEVEVLDYRDSKGLPVGDVWWTFAFLIHHTSTGRWLSMIGGASD